jgi:hypothetical protein
MAPTLNTVTPNVGTANKLLTFAGTGFVSGCTTTISGVAASVTFNSSISLTVICPLGQSGSVNNVVVTNPDTTLSIGGINLVTGFQDSTHINAVVPDIVGGPWDVTVRNSFKNSATLTKAITTKKRGS